MASAEGGSMRAIEPIKRRDGVPTWMPRFVPAWTNHIGMASNILPRGQSIATTPVARAGNDEARQQAR